MISRREACCLRIMLDMGGSCRLRQVSAMLGVKPATATELLSQLIEKGLVAKGGWGSYRLTARGEIVAAELTMKHRVLETFLVLSLGYGVDEACRISASFEHSVPMDVVARIYESLNRPCTCPHGKPIASRGVER